MLWFAGYCVLSSSFFVLGSQGLSLHWFWNSVFSLLASGTLTYATHRVVATRLYHRRLTSAIKRAANRYEIRAILEAASSSVPDLSDPLDGWFTGCFAYVPASVTAFVYLGLLINSTAWRVAIALASAIPLAVVVGKAVNRLNAQPRMLIKAELIAAEKTIADLDPAMADELLWARTRPIRNEAEADVTTAGPPASPTHVSGVCDICNRAASTSTGGKVFTAKEMKAATKQGFNGMAIGINAAMLSDVGITAADSYGEWKRKVAMDRTDWLLCRDCQTAISEYLRP